MNDLLNHPDWLHNKPVFTIHQSVRTTSGVLGLITGMQQVTTGNETYWLYQVFSSTLEGDRQRWFKEQQLSGSD